MDAKITIRYLLYGLTTLTLTLFPPTSQAQDADARTQELERKLKERDMVILELLERVETLERRVGVERIGVQSSQSSADVMEPDMVPGIEKIEGEDELDQEEGTDNSENADNSTEKE